MKHDRVEDHCKNGVPMNDRYNVTTDRRYHAPHAGSADTLDSGNHHVSVRNVGRVRPGWSAIFAALCLLMVGGTPPASAQSYSFTDLGTIGGTGGGAYGISDNGQVAGWSSTTGNAAVHATLWNNGAITDLGVLGGNTSSIAYGVNNAGQVVGRSIGSGGYLATLWSGGAISDLGFGNNSSASAINRSGQVVGITSGQAATWTSGSITNNFQTNFLRPSINDRGQIVGESGNKAVLWDSGVTTVLGALTGSVNSYAYAINSTGQIVGDSIFCGACNDRATLWDRNGSVINLGTLGGADSIALDINDLGQIVGNSTLSGGDYHATLWNAGVLLDLNSFLDASNVAAGWVLTQATAINDSGWIVGSAFNTTTKTSSAFLLASVSPIPEPETYAMLLAGLGLMGWVVRRRKGEGAAR